MPDLAGILARTARSCPDRIALSYCGVSHTYAEFDRRVSQLANELIGRGLRKGDRLLLVSGNSDVFVIALYAGLRAGAIVVPVNPRSAPREIDYFLSDTEAKILVFGPEVVSTISGWMSMEGRAADVPALALGVAPGYENVLACAADQPSEPPVVDLAEDDDALIIYTSGTTGRPKGALFDHHRIIWVGINSSVGFGLRVGERLLHVAPLYHSADLNLVLIPGMMLGATHVILPSFDPETVLETIEQERIGFFFGVPTMYAFLMRAPSLATRDLSSLRICMYGAAPMPAGLAQQIVKALPNAWIVQACGQTEGGPGGILLTHDEVLQRPSASGRFAIANTEVRIVDADGNDAVPGTVGEMIMRGETMMKGYWRKPEATAATIIDGWVHTGDLAQVDAEGFITIVDRLKDMIITGGRNVYSAEVESALADHPAVGDVAVVGRLHDEYGETVVAVVTPRENQTVTLEELREYARERIADYKLPRELVIPAIPRNPSGKILKHQLRDQVRG
ncbi:class I adenylate-forming enzyme family protein [Arthrobacter cryoconiti]|uniref:Class I adenylate-forming enzyme family protein n=1 Tax=Arthrobacter cryoconiti TaxID=748907 RepID=A0ABV8QWN5_9MICC|nr:long-chain fatty acid--CoA ligase [Arthrobacter cryoconiti]MCC9069690.1 long-chain fatty acid--CoA ligase [Arthrobacter cryoconiti]